MADNRKIFVHALEGIPDDPDKFTGSSERDIRVKWLISDAPGTGPGPWKVSKRIRIPNGIVLERSGRGPQPQFIHEVHLPFISSGDELAKRLVLPASNPRHVDFAPTLNDPDLLQHLIEHRDIRVVQTPGFSLFYLGFCVDKGAFVDPQLRRAAAYAINVHSHASLGRGLAHPAAGPVPSAMQGFVPRLRQRSYAPQRTKRSLAGTEHPSKQPITLLFNKSVAYAARLADAICKDLHPLRRPIEAKDYPSWGDLVAAVRERKGDMFLYSWHQREPHANDPYDMLIALFHSRNRGTTNLTGYSKPKVDAYLEGAASDHVRAQRKILRDAPMVFLSHWTRTAAYHTRVKDLLVGKGALPHDKLVSVDIR